MRDLDDSDEILSKDKNDCGNTGGPLQIYVFVTLRIKLVKIDSSAFVKTTQIIAFTKKTWSFDRSIRFNVAAL